MKHKNLSRGFSHHLLLPILAVFVVGAIGVVTLNFSSAASATKDCTNKIFGRYKNNPAYAKYDNYKSCVRKIQSVVGASVDGIYGNNTQAKVKAWQRNHSLTADGVVGHNTWAKMGVHPKYPSVTKRSCNAKSGYEWKSNKCQKKETQKKTTPTKTTTDKYAAERKECQSNGGTWDRNNYCMKKITFCDWTENGVRSKLTCHRDLWAEMHQYNELWQRNDRAWNACRAYFTKQRKSYGTFESSAQVERDCKGVVQNV